MKNELCFSVKALIIQDDKFLAVEKKTKHNVSITLPGEIINLKDSAENILKTKILMPLDLNVNQVRLLETWKHTLDSGVQVTDIIYLCIVNQSHTLKQYENYKWIDLYKIFDEFPTNKLIRKIASFNWNTILNHEIKFTGQVEQIKIDDLIPNDLYLNNNKIQSLKNASIDKIPPVLVTTINNELSLIDGHSRVWLAYQNGESFINGIYLPLSQITGSTKLYEKIHSIAKDNGITHISKLSNRILSEEDHLKHKLELSKGL